MAPHLFQKRLIDGFRKCDGVDLTVINVPPIGSFPMHYKKILSPKAVSGGDVQIGFINIPFFKYKFQAKAILREIRKAGNLNNDCEIIFYGLHEPFLRVANTIKNEYPNVQITMIQTDAVPGRNGMLKSKRAARVGDKLVKLAHKVDRFILLSEQLACPLEVGDRPYLLVECIANANQPKSTEKEYSENIFLYTGTTHREYGIVEFVDAFEHLPEATLWICGSGNSDNYIRNKMKKCENIKHFGVLNQKEVATLRDRCDFLINPRRPSGTYTKYSFPSKTAEYMMSGKPTVMYRLEAIPKEYDCYLTYLVEVSPDKIAYELRDIICSDYTKFKVKGHNARQFMLNQKTGGIQARRIYDFLNKTTI